jgi:hypothetical protein
MIYARSAAMAQHGSASELNQLRRQVGSEASRSAQKNQPQPRHRKRGPSKETRRNCDIRRFMYVRYGPAKDWQFPDDDAGRDDLFLMVHARSHVGVGETELRKEVAQRAPWLTEVETVALLDRVFALPQPYSAEKLGLKLGLTDVVRTELRAWSIEPVDVTKAERQKRTKAKRAANQRAKRWATGTRPREEYEGSSLAKTQPWKAFGISRRTWYDRGKPTSNMPANDVAQVCDAQAYLSVGHRLVQCERVA